MRRRNVIDTGGLITCFLVLLVLSIGVFYSYRFEARGQEPARPPAAKGHAPTARHRADLVELREHAPVTMRLGTSADRQKLTANLDAAVDKAIAAIVQNYLESCAAARTDREIDQAFERWHKGLTHTLYGAERLRQYQIMYWDVLEHGPAAGGRSAPPGATPGADRKEPK